MSGMTRREADAEAWERGEHTCQVNGHTASRDPQVAECLVCGVDITALDDGPDDDDWIAAVYEAGPPDDCYGNEVICGDTGIGMAGR